MSKASSWNKNKTTNLDNFHLNMSTSQYAVVRRLSRVFLLPLHGQNNR